MYSNLTKTHVFPLASRVSSKPRCFKSLPSSKSQSLRFGSSPKPSQNPESSVSAEPICCFRRSFVGLGGVGKVRSLSFGVNLSNAMWSVGLVGARSFQFHSSSSEVVCNARSGRSSWEVSAERLEKGKAGRSSWEESAERLENGGGSSREEPERNRSGRSGGFRGENRGNGNRTSTGESRGRGGRGVVSDHGDRGSRNRVLPVVKDWRKERSGSVGSTENGRGSRDRGQPVMKDWRRDRSGSVGSTEIGRGSRDRVQPATKDWRRDRIESAKEERGSRNRGLHEENDWRRDRIESAGEDRGSRNRVLRAENDWQNNEEEREDSEEMEVIGDARWDRDRNRLGRMGDVKESSLPLMIGEGVYGVGPVLAALSAGRRQFYELYVQEGKDMKTNARKKKDKKAFENVLRMAEKKGLDIKHTSKHVLNMIADNRPHQGLLLDASPLDLVNVKELPVSVNDDNSLWVALDEVTDPQNLGAIIRSAYFFGASGVVVCVKNSAPLSGVVSKASAGSLELMEMRSCKNMVQFLTSSSQNGWRVLGASVSADSVPLSEVSPGGPTLLVLGNEGKGLRTLVERSCSELVKIHGNIPVEKIAGGELENEETTDTDQRCESEEFRSFMAVESLNVSVATGVLLHHLIGNQSANAQ